MDNVEMRQRLAAIMGWSRIEGLQGNPPETTQKINRRTMPNYPKDHNGAMILLARLSGPPYYTFTQTPTGWCVDRPVAAQADLVEPRMDRIVADEPRLARAICLALLHDQHALVATNR